MHSCLELQRQHCLRFLPVQCWPRVMLIFLGQPCTRQLPVQGWPILLNKLYTRKQSTMLPGSIWANIAQENQLRNVGTWLTDKFYEENNLHNVLSIMLGQHCI